METMEFYITKALLFYFEDNIFWHLSGPSEQIYTHNKMSYVFNVGLNTHLDTSLPYGFSLIYSFFYYFS